MHESCIDHVTFQPGVVWCPKTKALYICPCIILGQSVTAEVFKTQDIVTFGNIVASFRKDWPEVKPDAFVFMTFQSAMPGLHGGGQSPHKTAPFKKEEKPSKRKRQ